MDRVRWERIAELYQAASESPVSERDAFLADACKEDDELRRDVESLLRQDVSQPGALERAAKEARSWTLRAASNRKLPVSVGRYRVLGLIGEGGMGTVYEAIQDQPHRTIALKVLKPWMATPELVRRFEQESEALGRLQHPGIARIYDAGAAETEFGTQPYFAMEVIRGLSLLEYARTHDLRTPQRLELMVKVCDAVHHAHEHGIIHRDLKPGNILVDETGQPKVLDFGVARITDSDAQATRQTDLGELVGTLAYMSPEQVLADPSQVDVLSDVYALGVVLYELLAGRLPYQVSRQLNEAVHTIREEDPAPLSAVSRAYRGDLETIVAKALEKDKTRRYASAAALADDLSRYLANQPVLAKPQSAAYQIQKFARRHKALVGTVAAVFVVLLGGILASTREAIRADRERDRATSAEVAATVERGRALRAERAATGERNRAEQERNHALEETKRADTEVAVAKAVNGFLQNDLLAQAGANAQAGPNTKPDKDLKVRTALDRAAARIKGKFSGQPAVEASIRATIGNAYFQLGLYPEAEAHLARALELRRSQLGGDNAGTLESMQELAGIYYMRAKYTEAEALLNQVLQIQLRLGRRDKPETLDTLNDLAELASARGDHTRAKALLTGVLERQRRLLGEENPDTLNTMNNLALEYSNLAQETQAAELYEHALETMRRVLGKEHPSTLLAMNNLGAVYRFLGKYAQAEELLTQVAEVRRRVLGDRHRDTFASWNSLGLVYAVEGKYAQSEALLKQALEGRRQVLGEDHPETVSSMQTMADLYRIQGKYPEAESWLRKTIEAQKRVLGPGHPNTRAALVWLGSIELEQGRYPEAEALLRESQKGLETVSGGTWRRYYGQAMLGASLVGLGEYGKAEPLLISGYQNLMDRRNSIPAENRAIVNQTRRWIAQLYSRWGKPEQAVAWRDAVSKN
jgi:eukaryotic-like serine/threonine-protein kinase